MRDVAEAKRFERDRSCRAQKCEVTETRLQLVISHWQIGLYAFLLDEPLHRGFFVAEFIDQLEIDRLVAGENPTVRYFFELVIGHAAAFFHEATEPGIGILYQRIQGGARFRAG